jgi:hypothetical protein
VRTNRSYSETSEDVQKNIAIILIHPIDATRGAVAGRERVEINFRKLKNAIVDKQSHFV